MDLVLLYGTVQVLNLCGKDENTKARFTVSSFHPLWRKNVFTNKSPLRRMAWVFAWLKTYLRHFIPWCNAVQSAIFVIWKWTSLCWFQIITVRLDVLTISNRFYCNHLSIGYILISHVSMQPNEFFSMHIGLRGVFDNIVHTISVYFRYLQWLTSVKIRISYQIRLVLNAVLPDYFSCIALPLLPKKAPVMILELSCECW